MFDVLLWEEQLCQEMLAQASLVYFTGKGNTHVSVAETLCSVGTSLLSIICLFSGEHRSQETLTLFCLLLLQKSMSHRWQALPSRGDSGLCGVYPQ